ncbi:MAG: ABC transporter permease [Mariprofundaceae bacterium]|nr:ABC transporter permease [Mariprofundaceae bacterium]
MKYSELIWYLAKLDLQSRFRKSKLGILWVFIQVSSFSIGAGFIWAAIFNLDPVDFVPFLAIGFSLWGLFVGVCVEGSGTFIAAQGYIKQVTVPLKVYILRVFLTQSLLFLISFSVSILILILVGKFHFVNFLYAFPGFFILTLFSVSVVFLMAYIGIRFRDVQHALVGIFQLLFVLTPVIYPPSVLIERGLGFAIYLNPFASLIDIIRTPLLHSQFANLQSYYTSILTIFFVSLLGWAAYRVLHKKVVYLL